VEYAVHEKQNCISHQTTWKLGFLRAKKSWVFLSSNYSEGTGEPTGKHHELINHNLRELQRHLWKCFIYWSTWWKAVSLILSSEVL